MTGTSAWRSMKDSTIAVRDFPRLAHHASNRARIASSSFIEIIFLAMPKVYTNGIYEVGVYTSRHLTSRAVLQCNVH